MRLHRRWRHTPVERRLRREQWGRPGVTESTQPLVAVPSEAVTVVAQPSDDSHDVSFTELAYARFDWWRSRQKGGAGQTATRAYDAARAAFEHRHGELVNAYWCSRVESAVALTEKKRLRGMLSPVWAFHRETDGQPRTCRTSPPSFIAATSSRCVQPRS